MKLTVLKDELARRDKQSALSRAKTRERLLGAVAGRAAEYLDFDPLALFSPDGTPLPLNELPIELRRLVDIEFTQSGELRILPPSSAVKAQFLKLAAQLGFIRPDDDESEVKRPYRAEFSFIESEKGEENLPNED